MRTNKIGIIGLGYIGISTMAHFASEGITCIGYDIDNKKVLNIKNGVIPIPELQNWLGFGLDGFRKSHLIDATDDFYKFASYINNNGIDAIIISVPTEKDSSPWFDAIENVMDNIVRYNLQDNLIIIESTLSPGMSDKIIVPITKNFVIAPRRDWFGDRSKTLKALPRIVGGYSDESSEKAINVLSTVCDSLLKCSYKEAELVKAVENAIRHVDITFANELALAFPDINIRKVMDLASTKWNVGKFIPSAGCGGYCIPLAPRYIIMSSKRQEFLSLLKSSINTDDNMPYIVAQEFVKAGCKNVGILGLCYKGDIKVDILSPTKKIVKYLVENNIKVKVNDPYYLDNDIKSILSVEAFDFPNGLEEFDGLILISDHMYYKSIRKDLLLNKLKNCKKILNSTEIWKEVNFKSSGIDHKYIGESGWLDIN